MIEVIPPGSSAVVTEKRCDNDYYRHRPEKQEQIVNVVARDDRHHRNHDVEIIEAVKDADAHLTGRIGDAAAGLERSGGQHFGDTMCAIKDAEADLERSSGQHFGNTVSAVKDAEARLQMSVKDAEADLERSSGQHFGDLMYAIKDAEADLERSGGVRYADTVKTIKDTEAQLDRASADRFLKTIEDVKQVEVATEKAKAKVLEAVREEGCETRELTAIGFKDVELELCKGVDNVKDAVQEARRELAYNQLNSIKDTLLEFKNTQNISYQLAAAAEKTACSNQTQTLLQFKDQALLSERLACQASKELAAQSCEIKEIVRAEAQATRALMNSFEQERLKEKAARAEAQLAAYFARGVAPVIP